MTKIILIGLLFGSFLWADALSKSINKHGLTIKTDDIKLSRTLKVSKANKNIVKFAKKYIGTKYRYGASTKTTKRFDCSSYVKYVFKKTKGKTLPRTSRQQARMGKHVAKKNLQAGDLVFFGSKRRIGHVGIYIGKNKFIHASSASKKVTISSLDKKYYKRKYRGARRV